MNGEGVALASASEDFILTRDLEALVLSLPPDAPSGEHPSVAFYRGARPVSMRSPPNDPQSASPLHVIALHQALLPPSPSLAAEDQSARLCSPDGVELLRTNWQFLLLLLFPSIQSTRSGEGGADETASSSDALASTSPIAEAKELYATLTYTDYARLREPGMTDRVHYSYVVVLRFFGWRLHDEERGVLDRHRGWRQRYQRLAQFAQTNRSTPLERADGEKGHMHEYNETNMNGNEYERVCFYGALTRVIRVLIELCLTRYAINLLAFLMEEMLKGRLLFLQSSLERFWLPQVLYCKQIAVAEKDRLRRQLFRLTHSDSD